MSKIQVGNKVKLLKDIDRACGSVSKGTKGEVIEYIFNVVWVKFPGYARGVKCYEDEIKIIKYLNL